MFTIIRRECFRLLDRHERQPMAVADVEECAPVGSSDPADALAEQRRAELLARALEALDPLQREVVLLRDIEGLSAPEAAARLGISIQALKSRLHRARVNLRDHVLANAEQF
jgi:RNA polymerase sigma factor (sigma-70 family)